MWNSRGGAGRAGAREAAEGGWDEVRKEARGGPLVRGPHSTDNVTFFNPRFTLFVLASAARKAPKQLSSTSVPRERISTTVPGSQRFLAGTPTRGEHLVIPRQHPRSGLAKVPCPLSPDAPEGATVKGNRREARATTVQREMSAVESALDVLSRAATMVQGQFMRSRFSASRRPGVGGVHR